MNKHRNQFEYSSEKLRRARRLYFFIISKHVPEGREGVNVVIDIAARLQERGFYSRKTNKRDIYFRCYRAMYKVTKEGFEGWFEWQMRRGYGRSPWYLNAA